MEIDDANVILRYLLNDDLFFARASMIVERKNVFIPFEVWAEVVYVLEKVYNVPRDKIRSSLGLLMKYPNIAIPDSKILEKSLEFFVAENLDFIDSMLVAYHEVQKAKIYTFDKKLAKYTGSIS